MFAKPLFVLSLLMASVGLLDAASSCAPSCFDAAEGDKVQVPWDCTKYAVCGDLHDDDVLWPSDPTSCPDDQYFNPNSTACAPIGEAEEGFCDNYCSPCVPYWSTLGDTTPHPVDCETYFTCIGSDQFVTIHCAAGTPDQLFYDYVHGGCSSDEKVCFNYCDTCQAYCVGETYIADPLDCTGFYYCSPPEMSHFHCPVNENFDPELKICYADAPCIPC